MGLILYFIFPIPKNVFRKLLHIAAFTSSIFVVLTGRGWLSESLTLALFALPVYPALKLAESWKGYQKAFVEKKTGEVRTSLLLLFLSQAAFGAFAGGYLKKPFILVTATAAWGLGDIAAAWVGRPFGRHKVHLPLADHNKSWEGSIAMAVTAFVFALVPLLAMTSYSVPVCVLMAFCVGIVSAYSEVISKNGTDTVNVPFANILCLWLLTSLF